MAEAAIITLLTGLVAKTRTILSGNWLARVLKPQPELALRTDTYSSIEGWSKTIDSLVGFQQEYVVIGSLKTDDLAARSVMLVLQYWNIFHNKEDIESRKLVAQTVASSTKIIKTFGHDISLGQHYLRELIVDLVTLLVSAPSMKTALNQNPLWGYGVVQTSAAHVVQLLIMKSQRHMVSVLEGVREQVDGSNTRLIGSEVCIQLFERSVFCETLFSSETRYPDEDERRTKILELNTSKAELCFIKDIMKIPIDQLKSKGATIVNDLSPLTEVLELIVIFDESQDICDILKPYGAEIVLMDKTTKFHLIRFQKQKMLLKWLYKNDTLHKISTDEAKRMRRGVSSFQDIKTRHLDRMADWGRNTVQYLANRNKVLERNNPRVKLLRKTIETLFRHSRISSANHDVSRGLRYTVKSTIDALVSTIGLVMTLMHLNDASLDIVALEEVIVPVRTALSEHWWTPQPNAKLTFPRNDNDEPLTLRLRC